MVNNTSIPSGKYIVAVSGGVDSIVLLHLLKQQGNLSLVVAHFNHGIRPDASQDEKLVKEVADSYGLPIEIGRINLGKDASEEQARDARYSFLKLLKTKHEAKAIITAHHQDDLIETAFINILRGTGVRGLTAISNSSLVMRPLLNTPKQDLISYAKNHHLKWREDTTNTDTKYLRNRIRKNILPLLNGEKRQELIKNIKNIERKQSEAESIIATLSQVVVSSGKIDRKKFTLLPAKVGDELVVYWFREFNIKDFDKKNVQHISMAIKTAASPTKHNIDKHHTLIIGQKTAYIMPDNTF